MNGENKVVVQTTSGVSFLGLLFLLLLGLKLGGAINWSWWAVTAPLWGPFALAVAVTVLIVAAAAVGLGAVWLYEKHRERRIRRRMEGR